MGRRRPPARQGEDPQQEPSLPAPGPRSPASRTQEDKQLLFKPPWSVAFCHSSPALPTAIHIGGPGWEQELPTPGETPAPQPQKHGQYGPQEAEEMEDRAGDTPSCGARRGRGEGGQGWYPPSRLPR